jgi:hypothetical protein
MEKVNRKKKVVEFIFSPFMALETIIIGLLILLTTPIWLFKAAILEPSLLFVIVVPLGFATWANWHFFGKR